MGPADVWFNCGFLFTTRTSHRWRPHYQLIARKVVITSCNGISFQRTFLPLLATDAACGATEIRKPGFMYSICVLLVGSVGCWMKHMWISNWSSGSDIWTSSFWLTSWTMGNNHSDQPSGPRRKISSSLGTLRKRVSQSFMHHDSDGPQSENQMDLHTDLYKVAEVILTRGFEQFRLSLSWSLAFGVIKSWSSRFTLAK